MNGSKIQSLAGPIVLAFCLELKVAWSAAHGHDRALSDAAAQRGSVTSDAPCYHSVTGRFQVVTPLP